MKDCSIKRTLLTTKIGSGSLDVLYKPCFKTIDLAPRPSEICEDRDVERRYPPKIEPAACNVSY